MTEYHKIQTVFKRDPERKHRNLIEGDFSLPEFEYLANNEWVFTEKVDGTNTRVMWDGNDFTFGGRTDNAQMPTRLFDTLANLFGNRGKFADKFGDAAVCLYGEGYGAKIQKVGANYRADNSFVLFDVRIGDWWLQRADVEDIAEFFGLDVVPIIGTGTLYDMVDMARSGITSTWGDFAAEGIVARPAVELKTRSGQRLITKIKTRDFN